MTKILHVETPTFEAQATFQRDRRGQWRCIRASPSVDWMEVAQLSIIRTWLERNGYKYRWEQG